MRYLHSISILAIALIVASCSGMTASNLQQATEVTPLHGSSLAGVTAEVRSGDATIHLANVPADGAFLRLELPVGQRVTASEWTNADAAVKLVVPVDEAAEVGIVPLSGAELADVSLRITFGGQSRTPSVPPLGNQNLITDLKVSDAGGGGVSLEWTQVNTGDYDFNGEVNLADLVPIALLFNTVYDRGAAGAFDTTEYWVDGDGNGEINAADVTPIGINYNAFIAGYNIYRETQLIPGAEAGAPTVVAADGVKRTGLPPAFSKVVTGMITDNFTVTPVDAEGVEGADSSGNAGPVDLLANLDIDGQLLLDLLDGQNPGPFGVGKIGARVIDPIEINNSLEVGDLVMSSASELQAYGLPSDKTLYLQIQYIPEVDLITGAAKGGASLRSPSALEDDIVSTSIPFKRPAGPAPVEVVAAINIGDANPDGGFYTYLHTEVTIPGDNPATPAVETQYTLIEDKRLDNFNGLVATDTDGNGDYEDEPHLRDDDHDCASERLRENELDDDEYDFEDRDEIEIEGFVSSFDEENGVIVLTGAVLEAGELEIPLPDPLTLYFSELTRFEERIKTDDDDIEADLDPSLIMPGDELHIDLYRLSDVGELLPDKYWMEKVERRIDLT